MPRRIAQNNMTERTIRAMICPVCYQRPAGSESLKTEPRSCEPSCQIFANIRRLRKIAAQKDLSQPGACERAIRTNVCSECTAHPSSGEFCAEFRNRTCPLSRYGPEVVASLETLLQWQARSA